jgi:protein-disulfide isomerase
MLFSRRTIAIAGVAAFSGVGAALADEGDDMSIGAAAAPVALIEYASSTCPHCAAFHESNWALLKANYIDTGRVRLTLREMLTPPPNIAFALFQLARCGDAGANEYFRRLAIVFQRQHALFETGTMEGLREALVALGAEWALTETQVMASLTDQNGVARLRRSIAEAQARGVTSTPSFYLNGAQVTDLAFRTPEGMARALDQAALG